MLRAIGKKEAGPYGAFLDTGEPVILFERHVFNRLTGGAHVGALVPGAPPEWALIASATPGGYGPVSVQHRRLQAAVELDRDAALKACSFGLYQCMGFNYQRAGFPTLQSFVSAMYRSVDEHLKALVMFIRSDGRLWEAVREKDFQTFKVLYNGPAHNNYAATLKADYEALA